MLRTLARLGIGAALVALPAAGLFMSHGGDGASAQGFPPDPPLVVHGDASGSEDGQSVHALVNDGTLWNWCGDGGVVDGGSYVVQVAADNQIEGCGAPGRTISLYFAPEGQYAGEGGRDATSTFSWQSSLEAPLEEDVTLGDAYTVRGIVPQVSGKVDH